MLKLKVYLGILGNRAYIGILTILSYYEIIPVMIIKLYNTSLETLAYFLQLAVNKLLKLQYHTITTLGGDLI